MKRSLPKCNLQTAQGTRCLHAIWNYMRKVKLKYQHVPPSLTYWYIHVFSHFPTGFSRDMYTSVAPIIQICTHIKLLADPYGMPFVTKIQYTSWHHKSSSQRRELPYYVVSFITWSLLSWRRHFLPTSPLFSRCHKVKMIYLDCGIDCGFL